MERVFFLHTKKKRILIMDILSIKNVKESAKIVNECEEMISHLPMKSVLLLTDATDSSCDLMRIDSLKSFSKRISPFILASSVVGAKYEKKLVIKILEQISERKIKIFLSIQETIVTFFHSNFLIAFFL
ncbi:MAG: hypothetical protein COX48_04920 [bacterium (Candidatus Stahlbacteria) CG23_combo_of_CG06-09_8_20_14_all_34_7]|nr:MAG: hypothetical protein COX48_04920 [bacterium (Candidatus Stahlbacteria) CG23_combo_of_CG06-09_8_20_14_all_34_7]